MNIDEMNEEEKNAPESGTDVSEGKNSNGSNVTAQAETQGSLNMDAKAEEPVMKETVTVKEAAPVKEVLKPGAQLAAFRIAAGIDQEQVAASLKMTVRQVRELEVDNYEALHGMAISRGFIRAYAKMLQVDPEPLVAMFTTEEPSSRQLDQIPRQSASKRMMQGSQSFGKKRGKTSWLILIVAVLALVYVAHNMKWFSFSFRKKAEPTADVIKQETSRSVSSEIEIPKVVMSEPEKTPASLENTTARDDRSAEAESARKGEDKSATVAEAASPEAEKQSQSQSRPDKEDKTPAPQPEKAAEAVSAAPQNFLIVRFSGPSKVQIRKADSSVLREFEGRAGDVQKVEINEPVTLVVEKAANVQAEFRDQPLVLRIARRSPEARVELK